MASCSDIWLVDFGDPYPGEPAGVRPALVVGPPDTFGPVFPFSFIVPVTTRRRELRYHVEIEASEQTGLDETSYVQCELIRSVNRKRLVHRIGTAQPDTSRRVATVLKTLLGH